MNANQPSLPRERVPEKLRILCADDDQLIREVLRLALTHDGHQVTVVRDGRSAHELVSATPDAFDLVITDHNMPGMTGVELVACLRALPYDGGILVMSGSLDRDTAGEYLKLGVRDLLEKPVLMQDLLAAVRRAAARNRRELVRKAV